jgi:hypothetical protein
MPDIFRIFKSCFVCDSQDNLSRINFAGKYIYYHKDCLQRVLDDPQNNLKKIKKALMVYDQLISDAHQLQCEQFVSLQGIKDVQQEAIEEVLKSEELVKFKQIFNGT